MLFAHTPNTKKLIGSGAYSFHAESALPVSLSGPNWASILTGLTSRHGVESNFTTSECLSEHRNIFELAKRSSPDTTTFLASAINGNPPWPGIEHMLLTGCDNYKHFDGIDDVSNLKDAMDSCTPEADLNIVYTHLV